MIKSFTDISQSKKLAEILPLESADMKYEYPSKRKDEIQEPMIGFHTSSFNWFKGSDSFIYFPCWSLASLLELLPKRLEIVDNVYELSVYLYGLYYWNINNGNLCFEAKDNDNLVDACYEAIVFLYEQKLL